MSTGETVARERLPRRGRYLIPQTAPRRAELIAAAGVAAVVAHLLFAQLTIVLAVVFHAVTKATKWRPQWLAVPAVAGLTWALAIGLPRAAAGLTAGPQKIIAYLGGVGAAPGRALHLGAAFGGVGAWLPRQFPLALAAAAAEAAVAAWLSWLHTDEWNLTAPRPGLVSAARRWYVTREVRRGAVVTRDGACLGVAAGSGGRAALSWREAAGGVLCAGSAGFGTTTTSFQLVHAAIRRRKPVIAVDLSGSRQLAEWFAIVCGATNTPLQVFGPAGPGYYEPLRDGETARRTALVMGMADWTGIAGQHRRSCGAYLNDLFAVLDAAPGAPGTRVLDEVSHLLHPGALRARAGLVPGFQPRREALIERVEVSASLLEADPQIAAGLAGQLGELRASPFGRWLAPAPGGTGVHVDLGRAVRKRGVVLFSLGEGAAGGPAAMVASLVAQDVMAICAELRMIGVAGDGLLWFEQCGAVPPAVLTELVRRGAGADLAALLTTTSAAAADGLADHVNAVVIHRMTDPAMAERFARITGERLVPAETGPSLSGAPQTFAARSRYASHAGGAPATGPSAGPQAGGPRFVRKPLVSPESLFGLGKGEFVMAVKQPARRLVPLARTVPARLHVSPRRAAAGVRPPALATVRPVPAAALRRQAPAGVGAEPPGAGRNGSPAVHAPSPPSGRQRPSPQDGPVQPWQARPLAQPSSGPVPAEPGTQWRGPAPGQAPTLPESGEELIWPAPVEERTWPASEEAQARPAPGEARTWPA